MRKQHNQIETYVCIKNEGVCMKLSRVMEEKEKISVFWEDNMEAAFYPLWLRHNCQCPLCCQPQTEQKLIKLVDLLKCNACLEINILEDGSSVKVIWSDHHVSLYDSAWLRLFLPLFSPSDHQPPHRIQWHLPSSGTFPQIDYSSLHEEKGIWNWLYLLNQEGVVLIRRVPREEGLVKEIAEKIAPIQKTIYGEIFDVKPVESPINIAYTNAPLDFHMDLPYYESPPGIQLLHCLHFDDAIEGGESIFIDVFGVAEKLRSHNPKAFHSLCTIPATFKKIHFKRDVPVMMEYQRPHINVNPDQEIVGVNWAPAFEGPLKVASSQVSEYYEAYLAFFELMEESSQQSQITFRMAPGDLFAFNNRRMLHGRKGFSQAIGNRHLQGAYVNIDEFFSRLKVLCKQYGNLDSLKPVGNQSWK